MGQAHPRKRRLLRRVHGLLRGLRADRRVLEAVAFDGLLAPPGRGDLLKERPEVPIARFDLAVLVETISLAAAADLEAEPPWGSWSPPSRRPAAAATTSAATTCAVLLPDDTSEPRYRLVPDREETA